MRRLLLLLALFVPLCAVGQVVRIGAGPRPAITVGSVSLSASPSNVSFTLVPGGISTASQPVTISTGVSGIGLLSSMQVYAYFASTSALNDGAGNTIPSSAVSGICSTCASDTAYTAFTQSTPAAGSSLLLYSDSSLARLGGGRNDALTLRIDLSSLPQAPAGNYQGTLTLLIQSF